MPVPYSSDDIRFYRTHQIISYNASKAQFQMRVLAIAPLVMMYNDSTEIRNLEPLFWFKPDMNKPNLSSDDIVWAQRIVSRNNSLVVSKAKIFKNTMSDTLLNHFMQSFENQMDIPFWGIEDSERNSLTKFDNKKRKTYLSPIDTFDTTDKKTNESALSSQQKWCQPQDIKSIRLYQEWFWDDRQNRLSIHLKMVAPNVAVKNEYGEYLYDLPLFFRKTDD